MSTEKEVLLIFKTHLDVGYTDSAENVMNLYLNTYIPDAIKVGYELMDTDTPYIWTTGSYLIWEALKNDGDGSVDQAIKDGILSWHGLPCTANTEVQSEELLEYGLSIADTLDERYGVNTTGSKMTDVPGHTVGMVPVLAKHGIKLLHIGVNAATPMPNVPGTFVWKYEGSEIVVIYEVGYGGIVDYGDLVIRFCFTGDNLGPHTADEVRALYEETRAMYPGYTVKAATMNDVADRLYAMKDRFPVVENEIGDTWIHIIGTDPLKLSRYKELLRVLKERGCDGIDLSDNLLLASEHTWGPAVLNTFKDVSTYMPSDFRNKANDPGVVALESMWKEQRDYLDKAAELYGVTFTETVEPSLDGFTEIDAASYKCPVSVIWQLFSEADYDNYAKTYMALDPMKEGNEWVRADFTKWGIPHYSSITETAVIKNVYEKDGVVLCKMQFDKKHTSTFGLPYIWVKVDGEDIEISWFGMKKSRLPQAFWVKFVGIQDSNWQVSKLGQWIKPETIIASPLIMATDDNGVKNDSVQIYTYDSALVSPFGMRLLDFELNPDPSTEDMYFNLYNNIWGTNAPMWFDDNVTFRFKIVIL